MQLSEISLINESWFELLARRKRELQSRRPSERLSPMVAVFGGADFTPESDAYKSAYQVGRQIALQGGIVVSGGYEGVMAGASQGARSAGGRVVGITCDNLPEDQANEWVTDEWQVPRWDQRLMALVWLSDGYVAMPGSSGTLVELSMVIETQKKGFIPRRPAVCFGSFWRPVVKRIDRLDGIIRFSSSAEVCARLALGR